MRSLPWTLAWARLRKYPLRTFSVAVAVALALLTLLALQGISYSTSNSLVSYSLAQLPAGERTLTVTSSQIITSADKLQVISDYLPKHLNGLATGGLTREFLYNLIPDPHGVGFHLAGVDHLANSITLTSGRLPKTCTPQMCEVIQVGGAKSAVPNPSTFGLVIVGNGNFKDSQLFTGALAVNDGAPILVVDGVATAGSLSHFVNFQGTDAWVVQMDLAHISRIGATAYINSILAFENQLSIDQPELNLDWPQDALGTASDQSSSISDKFTLLEFVVGALLIAFLILFSLRYRRDHQQFRAGLSRIGTPKLPLLEELLIESVAPLILGIVLSLLLSFFIPISLSAFNFHTNLSHAYRGSPNDLILLLACLSLVVGTTVLGDKAWRRQIWIPFLFGTSLIFLFLFQSNAHEKRFWVIPFVLTLIPAFISYLLLRSLIIVWRNKNSHTYVLFREHLSMWQGVSAILTLTSILAVVALSFDSGITQTVVLQSQEQVPLDVSLRTGTSLIRPLDLGGTKDYERLLSGTNAYPILRSGTGVRNQNVVSDTLSLIGVPPGAVHSLRDASLSKLSTVLVPKTSPAERGIEIGASKTLTVLLSQIPKEVDLLAWFLTPNGKHISASLSGSSETRSLTFAPQVPSQSILIAFEFRETSDFLSRRLHAVSEGRFAIPILKGSGSIVDVSLDGRSQSLPSTLWGSKNFSYAFNGGGLYIRPKDSTGIPNVIVDPATALLASKGLLTVTGAGQSFFQVRVAAVTPTFPSAGDRFVIMNLEQLQEELGQVDLGIIDPIELWVTTPNSDEYLRNLNASPLQGLEVQSKLNLERELKSNPTNVGLNGSYRLSLLYSLLLTVFLYATALPLLYREGAGILFHLEATGVGPRRMRRALRTSLRLAVSLGVLLGSVIGLLVGRFFISPSTPYILIGMTLVSTLVLAEFGGLLITRRFFNESTMVEV